MTSTYCFIHLSLNVIAHFRKMHLKGHKIQIDCCFFPIFICTSLLAFYHNISDETTCTLNNRCQLKDIFGHSEDAPGKIKTCKHVVTILLGPTGWGHDDVLQLDCSVPHQQSCSGFHCWLAHSQELPGKGEQENGVVMEVKTTKIRSRCCYLTFSCL